MAHLNISQKFVGYLIFISFLPLLVVGFVSYRTASNTLEETSSRYTLQLVRNQRDYIDLQMAQIEGLLSNISGLEEVRHAVVDTQAVDDTYNNLIMRAAIGNTLSGYLNLRGLVSIDIFTTTGIRFHVGDTLNTDDLREDLQAEIFATAIDSEKVITWIGIEDNINMNSDFEKVITVARVLYRLERETLEQEVVALLIINYDVESLAKYLDQTNLGDGSYFIVVDGKGDMIYHPDRALRGLPVSPVLADSISRMQTSGRLTIDGRDWLVNFSNSDLTDWTVIGLIPFETMAAQSAPIARTTTTTLFFAFLAVMLTGIFYNQRVVTPIRQITHQYQLLENKPNEMVAMPVPVYGNDEISELSRWFNTFLDIQATQKRTETALRDSLKTAGILYDFSRAMIGFNALPSLLQTIVDNLVLALGMNRMTLILLDTDEKKVSHFVKAGNGIVAQPSYEELMEGLTGYVWHSAMPVLSPGYPPDERESDRVQQRRKETNSGDLIVVPLIYGDEKLGTMTAIMPPDGRPLTPQDLDLLTALANQASVAISNARLVQSLRESEEKFFKVFHASPEPITIISMPRGIYLNVNDSFLAMTRFEREEVIGRHINDVDIWRNDSKQEQFHKQLAENGEMRDFQVDIFNKEGELAMIASVSATTIELNNETCVLTIKADITKHKRLEKQRIDLAIERERVHILSGFIAEASHEFKTPLSIINTKAYLASKSAQDEKRTAYLAQINEQVDIIASLVDSLSLMTKLDGGNLVFNHTQLEMNSILKTLHFMYKAQIDEKALVFNLNILEKPIFVSADLEYLKMALQHIIGNAIKFTDEGTITLTTDLDGDHILIQITDTGIGMNEEVLKHIFERFYQADQAGTIRGFGLGLPIARAIFEAFGGWIDAESVYGVGSTFTIHLPTA